MNRKREFTYASAPERFRPVMREAFPPLFDIPATMRAVLAELDPPDALSPSAKKLHQALEILDADEKRDAQDNPRAAT